MEPVEETCWTLIRAAADGDASARADFTRRYLPVARAFFGARWGTSLLASELDDAVQEAFLDCFRSDGALHRADPERSEGFRAFFFGVLRYTALHFERRKGRELEKKGTGSFHPELLPADEESVSRVLDKAWARALVREAGELQARRARSRGPEAARRVELLQLRFHEGLPIREIARLWNEDAAKLHHEYATARQEFLAALSEVVGVQEGISRERLEAECKRLLALFG